MKKSNKPILTDTELIREISKRTGLTFDIAFQVVSTYSAIIKECIANEVEVKMGDLGVMSWKVKQPHYGVIYYDFQNGRDLPPQDTPGFNIPIFRPKKTWRTELKELTKFWEKENKEGE